MKEKKIRLEITLKEYAELKNEAPEGSVLEKIIKRYEDNVLKREYWNDMHYAPTEQERAEARELYLAKINGDLGERYEQGSRSQENTIDNFVKVQLYEKYKSRGWQQMNEAEVNHILDNMDLENNHELDMTKAEHDLIIERYRRELSQMQLEEFIGCVMEDCYKLGLAKALLMTMDK